MIEFKPLADLADKVGVIQAVKDKLVQQHDPAVEKFITAPEEISKLYSAHGWRSNPPSYSNYRRRFHTVARA